VPFTDLTGFGRHPLKAMDPQRYSMAVNGPWRITFEFRDGDGYLVVSEQYQ
jgi:proteic killer suppression protein